MPYCTTTAAKKNRGLVTPKYTQHPYKYIYISIPISIYACTTHLHNAVLHDDREDDDGQEDGVLVQASEDVDLVPDGARVEPARGCVYIYVYVCVCMCIK